MTPEGVRGGGVPYVIGRSENVGVTNSRFPLRRKRYIYFTQFDTWYGLRGIYIFGLGVLDFTVSTFFPF